MKWIKLPKIIPTMKDLLHTEQQLREDTVSVVPIPGVSKRAIDRTKPRPWHTIPNIKDFEIELRPFDWLLSLFGITKRLPSKTTLYTWYNGNANVYLDYMFKRLSKQVSMKRYDLAERTMWVLMNSTSYQVASMNYVFKNWHRELTWKEVRILVKQVDKLAKKAASSIEFSRAYIPKGESWRPLGVPTPAWRVYLHMYNNLLVEWRNVTEPGNQHAYLPGKGILTAWQDLTAMLNKPNIYEADFIGFFNNVTHVGIEHVLYNKLKLPFHQSEFVLRLNESLVKLQEVDKVPEKDREYSLDATGKPNPQARPEWHHRAIEVKESNNIHIEYLPDRIYLEKVAQMKKQGVPQGAATSCSLATLALRHLDHLDCIFYADDIIYFPKSSDCDPIKDLTKALWGLKVHPDKSRWIKKDGIWQVNSFKFLGIRYFPGLKLKFLSDEFLQAFVLCSLFDLCLGNPYTVSILTILQYVAHKLSYSERYVADTRNGASLEFTHRESFLSWLAIARQLLIDSEYFKKGTFDESLTEWLNRNYNKWKLLLNPKRLLFVKPFKNKKVSVQIADLLDEAKLESPQGRQERLLYVKDMLKSYEGESERFPSIERDLKKGIVELMKPANPSKIKELQNKIRHLERKLWVQNPLMGFFVSRMHQNSWSLSVEQNFKLKYIAGSWVESIWPTYAWQNILPRQHLTVFTASSFACHDLLEELRNIKRGHPQVRRVSVTRHKNLSRKELMLLKILVMFRGSVG